MQAWMCHGAGPSKTPGKERGHLGRSWLQLCIGLPLPSDPRPSRAALELSVPRLSCLCAVSLGPGPPAGGRPCSVNTFSLVIMVQHRPFSNKNKRNHSDLYQENPLISAFCS